MANIKWERLNKKTIVGFRKMEPTFFIEIDNNSFNIFIGEKKQGNVEVRHTLTQAKAYCKKINDFI